MMKKLKLNIFSKKNALYLSVVPILYLLFVTFPGIYTPITTGLDPSWQYALNWLPYSGYVFGKDVTFTYGPLGYFLDPLNVGDNLRNVVIFWLIVQILFGASLLYYLYKTRRFLPMVFYVITYIVASMTLKVAGFDNYLLIVVGLILCVSIEYDDNVSWIAALISGFIAGMFLFIKFNLFMAVIMMIFIYFLVLFIKKHRYWQFNIILNIFSCLLTINLLGIILLRSYSNLFAWFRESYDIISGYSVAMSIVGSYKIVMLGLLGLIFFIILMFLLYKKKLHSFYIAFIFIGPLFLSFKEGFVRQDGHVLGFFAFILAVSALLILFTVNKEDIILHTICFLAMLLIALPVFNYYHVYSPLSAATFITGKEGWNNIYSTLHLKTTQQKLDRETNMVPDLLPPAWVSMIGDDKVEFLPWEIVYGPANNLTYSLNPVLQTYSAYTSFLDRWCAEHYMGVNPPDYLIVEYEDIDGRNLMLDTPDMWRSIMNNYQIVDKNLDRGIMLLERKSQPPENAIASASKLQTTTNKWIAIPSSSKLLFAGINMHLNILGLITKMLFRIPPVNIDLMYDDGRMQSYRIIPETAADGLLINYIPTNLKDLSNLFGDNSDYRVINFKISGPGVLYYNKLIDVNFMESTQTINYVSKLTNINLAELKFVDKSTSYSIDSINDLIIEKQKQPIIFNSQNDGSVSVNGWAVDSNAGSVAGGVFLNIDGKIDIPAYYGTDRNDVADFFKNNHYRYSGFSGILDISSLTKGRHTLSIKVVTADKKGYYQPEQK
jgi:hypothetical protein